MTSLLGGGSVARKALAIDPSANPVNQSPMESDENTPSKVDQFVTCQSLLKEIDTKEMYYDLAVNFAGKINKIKNSFKTEEEFIADKVSTTQIKILKTLLKDFTNTHTSLTVAAKKLYDISGHPSKYNAYEEKYLKNYKQGKEDLDDKISEITRKIHQENDSENQKGADLALKFIEKKIKVLGNMYDVINFSLDILKKIGEIQTQHDE